MLEALEELIATAIGLALLLFWLAGNFPWTSRI